MAAVGPGEREREREACVCLKVSFGEGGGRGRSCHGEASCWDTYSFKVSWLVGGDYLHFMHKLNMAKLFFPEATISLSYYRQWLSDSSLFLCMLKFWYVCVCGGELVAKKSVR